MSLYESHRPANHTPDQGTIGNHVMSTQEDMLDPTMNIHAFKW